MTALYDRIQEIVNKHIRPKTNIVPEVAIILGTGLGALAKEIENPVRIPYNEIPGFPVSTVESHVGRFNIGTLAGKKVIVMEGRFHLYEGYSAQEVTMGVRVMHALGAKTLLVSCAVGGLNPQWRVGDLMLIEDHINLQNANPLVGENDNRLGPRFPDMSQPYSLELIQSAQRLALENQIRLQKGVLVSVLGPNLETRAEYRFLRGIGADVVGMSTVPEVIVANHAGMKVLGVAIVTDACMPDALKVAKVEDIIAIANEAEPKLTKLTRLILKNLPLPQGTMGY
ncbi:MAG: purine-nucleoside phosphorylase [Planctomycetota bacterium]